jgi:sulfite reductase (NADPH) flavoprotein alpha-component
MLAENLAKMARSLLEFLGVEVTLRSSRAASYPAVTFSSSDMSSIPFVPDDAPFTPEQRAWLNQFFAANFSPAGGAAISAGPPVPVTVLYASQTGNAEGLAKKLVKDLKKGNFLPTLSDLAQYDPSKLAAEKHVLLIASTYGDGEPPDSATAFHQWLHSDAAPSLAGVKYSVLALGDSSYPDFCQCGIEFDTRFAELGAERLHTRIDCDVEFDAEYKAWSQSIIALLAPGGAAVKAVAALDQEEEGYSKNNPFAARLLRQSNLNGKGSEKQTHHIEISLTGSGLEYQVGDALGVVPQNSTALVDELLSHLPFNTKADVSTPDGEEISLRDALIRHYDIRTLSSTLIEKWQARSGSPFLRSLVQANDKKAYQDFIWGRELIDLVIDYPADFSDAEDFVAVLRKLQPRLYSISSSPLAHPGEVHLTVGVVTYKAHGRERAGVCSSFLARLAANDTTGVYVHQNPAFRLPADSSTPLIMVGPGTGIAPFRAFLEERQATAAKGKNWLFFGNPHAATDYLYQEQLQQFVKDGVLQRIDTAFSRDQAKKIYVQDRMIEQGAELWKWLEEGAAFYVCGDASRMAKDVDLALHQLIQTHGKKSQEEATAYVAQLKKDKRYQRDVY